MFAGILFPISMFIYAWASLPNVSWVGSAIGIVVSTNAPGEEIALSLEIAIHVGDIHYLSRGLLVSRGLVSSFASILDLSRPNELSL